ncbi:MAG: family 43 glycosylhydrolase [Reichenbachiella sp.]
MRIYRLSIIVFAFLSGFLHSCGNKQVPEQEIELSKMSAAMQRFKGNDSDNELYTRFRYAPVEGLGYEVGVHRRDPSTIIKVDGLYYVWYTRTHDTSSSWLLADLWYATSEDGVKWTEKGPAVVRGEKGAWDDYSVFTCNVLVAEGKYYLCYQARAEFEQRNVIGLSWADSPDGPWTKLEEPILKTTPDGKLVAPNATGHSNWQYASEFGSWDSGAIHDPGLIIRDGKYFLYYKGHPVGEKMYTDSKWGLAVADKPEGPYIKHEKNPVTNSGHEIWVFPWKTGIAAIVDWAGPEKGTVQYSEDGVNFEIMTSLEDIPPAGGAYVADKYLDNRDGQGFTWGLCHYGRSDWAFLTRFDCELKRGVEKRLDFQTFPHYSTIRDVMQNPSRFGVPQEALLGRND